MGGINLTALTTEKRNPHTMNLDEMKPGEIIGIMNREDRQAVEAVERVLPQVEKVISCTVASLKEGGRIIYIGAGTSGRLGVLDAVECPPTFGVSDQVVTGVIAGGSEAFLKAVEGAEDDREAGAADLQSLKLAERDTVIGLTASGRTPYVIGALAYAKTMKCRTAAISCNLNAEVSKFADIAIEVETGPEILSGSTRLKAGTAEKLILNMISTVSMIETGKVYKNLMVDVRQTNEKLMVRAENIVMQAVDCRREDAKNALAEADGEAKTAVLKLLLGVDAKTAREMLEQSGGRIRAVMCKYGQDGNML